MSRTVFWGQKLLEPIASPLEKEKKNWLGKVSFS
jgi:hypothetical protein